MTLMADAHAAARDGNLEALQEIIAAGGNLNQRDKHSRTPLHLAAWAGKACMDMHVCCFMLNLRLTQQTCSKH